MTNIDDRLECQRGVAYRTLGENVGIGALAGAAVGAGIGGAMGGAGGAIKGGLAGGGAGAIAGGVYSYSNTIADLQDDIRHANDLATTYEQLVAQSQQRLIALENDVAAARGDAAAYQRLLTNAQDALARTTSDKTQLERDMTSLQKLDNQQIGHYQNENVQLQAATLKLNADNQALRNVIVGLNEMIKNLTGYSPPTSANPEGIPGAQAIFG